MPSLSNIEKVRELAEKLKKASSVIMIDNKGLDALSAANFRKKIVMEPDLEYIVIKNKLFKNALKNAGINLDLEDDLKGQTSFLLSYAEDIKAYKLSSDFSKTIKGFQVKTSILEGKKLDSETIGRLSKISSKEDMIAQLVMYLKLPLYKLHSVLTSRMSSLENK